MNRHKILIDPFSVTEISLPVVYFFVCLLISFPFYSIYAYYVAILYVVQSLFFYAVCRHVFKYFIYIYYIYFSTELDDVCVREKVFNNSGVKQQQQQQQNHVKTIL